MGPLLSSKSGLWRLPYKVSNLIPQPFFIQIHGLAPVLLHEGTAEKIGHQIGSLQEYLVDRRCIVGQRYLRIRVDRAVSAPILAGFFQTRNAGEGIWIQLKYERLSDFCYKYGALDHVTGRCPFQNPAIVSSPNCIIAKLFGPWLRSEHSGNLLFITPATEMKGKEVQTLARMLEEEPGLAVEEILLGGNCRGRSAEKQKGKSHHEDMSKNNHLELFQNEVNQSTELEALLLTLKKQEWRGVSTLQEAVLNKMQRPNFEQCDISYWASNVIQKLVIYNNLNRNELGHWMRKLFKK